MILIDTNAMVLLILGLIDPNLVEKHRRTSLYTKNDFQKLSLIVDINKLLVLPNIWTEVDNLLNDSLAGNHKWQYVQKLKVLISKTSEEYLPSVSGVNSDYFINIGLTDSLIIELREKFDLLITGDSRLSLRARAYGIQVYDLVEERNKDFK